MPTLEEVNALVNSGITEFRFESFDGSHLVVIGSFDLAYYHDVELTFSEVSFINCPTLFHEPQFNVETRKDESGGGQHNEGQKFLIVADEGAFHVLAESVYVSFGKVFHYDRGQDLKAGERIASWVRKSTPEGGA